MRQQIILFDGPDGCGKTNISNELSNRLGIPVFKNRLEWEHFGTNSSEDYFEIAIKHQHPYVLSLIQQTGYSVIFDRAHPSEWVYPRAFNRSGNDGPVKACDEVSASLGAKLIIPVRSDYSMVHDEFGITHDQLLTIDSLYREYATLTSCDCLLLNVDDEDLEREIEEIMQFLGGEQ